jgi:hypothetical protein
MNFTACENSTRHMECSFLTSSIFNILGRHQLIFPDKLLFFLMESVHLLNVKNTELLETIAYCLKHSVNSLILPFLCLLLTTLLIVSVCYTACNCQLLLPVTGCYFFLLSVFLTATACYFSILQVTGC